MEKLEELQSLIVNPDDVGEPLANPEVPNRRLLYKGALDRILPTGVVEDGIVILLSDLLIYCLEDAHGMLTVDGVIEITEGASVKAANQVGSDGTLYALNVLSSEGYGYTFVAEDASEQQFWFDQIMLAIDPEYDVPAYSEDQEVAPSTSAARAVGKGNHHRAGDDDEEQSPYSSRPPSRQSVRTYEEDLSVASHDNGAAEDDVEPADDDVDDDGVASRASSSRPQSRNSFRNRSSTPDLGALKLSDRANASSLSSSRMSSAGYKSPDSFLSQRSVTTMHPQDAANEEALMSQVAMLPNLQQVATYTHNPLILPCCITMHSLFSLFSSDVMLVTIRLQIQHIAEALGKRTIEQRLLMMSNPEGCVMIKFNVSNGNPVRTPLAALTSSDLPYLTFAQPLQRLAHPPSL